MQSTQSTDQLPQTQIHSLRKSSSGHQAMLDPGVSIIKHPLSQPSNINSNNNSNYNFNNGKNQLNLTKSQQHQIQMKSKILFQVNNNSNNVETQQKQQIQMLNTDIYQVIALKNSSYKVAACFEQDREIRMFDLRSSKVLNTLHRHDTQVFCLCSLYKKSDSQEDHSLLVSGGFDNNITVWDLDDQRSESFMAHTDSVYALACLENGHESADPPIFASGGKDHTVKIWRYQSSHFGTHYQNNNKPLIKMNKMAQVECNLKGHHKPVRALAFTDASRLLSGSYDNSVKVWDVQEESQLSSLFGHTGYVMCLKYIGNERFLSGSVDQNMGLWDLRSNKLQAMFQGHIGVVNAIEKLDDYMVCSAGDDGVISVFDLRANRLFVQWKAHDDWVRSLCIVSQSNQPIQNENANLNQQKRSLVSSSKDGFIKIWDLKTINGGDIKGTGSNSNGCQCIIS